MKLNEYKKNLISLMSFLNNDNYWEKLIASCLFVPKQTWKEWENPWGSFLKFSSKNRKPIFRNIEIDEEQLKIFDLKHFSSLEEIKKISKWKWYGYLNNKEYKYFYDGKFCRLFCDGQPQNPVLNGYEIIYDAIKCLSENTEIKFKKKWINFDIGEIKHG